MYENCWCLKLKLADIRSPYEWVWRMTHKQVLWIIWVVSYDNSGKLGFSVIFWFYCTGVGGQVLSFEWEAVCCVYASMKLSDFIIYLCFKWTYMLLKCLSWNPSCLQCVLPFFPTLFFLFGYLDLHYLNVCLLCR